MREDMHAPVPPPPLALVRTAVLLPVVRFLVGGRWRVERLLDEANLPPRALDAPDALVSTHQVCGFMAAAARETGVENLGLVAGRDGPFELLGTFGRVVRGTHTLAEAIQAAMRLMPAFSSGGRCHLASEGDRVRLSLDLGRHLEADDARARDICLMLSLGLVLLVAEPRPAGRVGALGYADILPGVRIYGECPAMGVTFPRALLSRPLTRSNASRRIDGADVARWLASGPADDFPGSLLQAVTTLSSPTYPRIARAASSIGMSIRGLQRRLAEDGVSYGHLLDRARFAAAVDLLEHTDASVLDVALDVGYSDHAHFTRAFRRWTGLAPRVFRHNRRRMQETRRVANLD